MGWLGVRVSSSRWGWVGGGGSAERRGGWLRAEWRRRKFGVGGGGGEVALVAGGGVPVCAVGHHGGEDGFAVEVGVVHGLVAGGQCLLPSGVLVLAAVAGGVGFGGGVDGI